MSFSVTTGKETKLSAMTKFKLEKFFSGFYNILWS